MPTTPNVSRSATDCQVAECVSFHTVNIKAVYAAAPPVTEIRRPMASLRTLDLGERLMKRLLWIGRVGEGQSYRGRDAVVRVRPCR
jgi:hypothetical protein